MNLNTPRLVSADKLTEADIDRMLADREADFAQDMGPSDAAVAVAKSLLRSAAMADHVHGIPVTPFKDLRRERALIPRRRPSMLSDLLNCFLILAGFVAAHWRTWLPAAIAIGATAWWCFH